MSTPTTVYLIHSCEQYEASVLVCVKHSMEAASKFVADNKLEFAEEGRYLSIQAKTVDPE